MEQSISHKVSYRNIKYPRLEFKTGELLCILPPGHKPDILLEKYKGWILKKSNFIKDCLKAASKKKLINRTDKEFKALIYSCIENASDELGTTANNIYLRKMKTKWASLSHRKNLTINMLMKYLPEHLIDYIIFHELAHTIEKRHNEKFWEIISKRFMNYSMMEKELFVYWFLIAKKPYYLSIRTFFK